MLRLDPPLPVFIRLREEWHKAMAHVLIDYGYEFDLAWVVFIDRTGECWTMHNRDVRLQENITAGRAR